MVIKRALRLIARRIAAAVEHSAADQGLTPDDYALIGSYDEHTDRISLAFGTDRSIDQSRLYADIIAEIRRQFPDFPQITYHIGLVIRRVGSLDEVYLEGAGAEDELDLTLMLERP
jgi:hypothetical protein